MDLISYHEGKKTHPGQKQRGGKSIVRGREKPWTETMLSYQYLRIIRTKGKIYFLLPCTAVAEFQHFCFDFRWSWFFMVSQLLGGFKLEQNRYKISPMPQQQIQVSTLPRYQWQHQIMFINVKDLIQTMLKPTKKTFLDFGKTQSGLRGGD